MQMSRAVVTLSDAKGPELKRLSAPLGAESVLSSGEGHLRGGSYWI
jgi:hypothetical protein